MNNEVFGVIVVLYFPTEKHVNNLLALEHKGMKLCLVDNTPNENENNKLFLKRDISYIDNRNIGGIAGAFNKGFSYLSKQGCAKVFTFDQDSIIPTNFFEEMLIFAKINNARITCPNFFDINAKTFGKFVKLTQFGYQETSDNKTHFCISSGMLIDTAIFDSLGGFDEDLIIDHVDTDFAFKALVNNEKIFFAKDIVLEHQIGEREKHKFLGVTLKPNHHNKLRKYYISRNGTYLSFKYFKQYKGYFVLNFNRLIHEILCVILYEKNKLPKILSILRGLKDAFFLYKFKRTKEKQLG